MSAVFKQLPISRMRLYLASEHEDGYQRDELTIKTPRGVMPRAQYMADTYDEELDDPLIACIGDDVDGKDIVIMEAGHRLRMHQRLGTEKPWCRLLNGGGYTSPREQARLFRKRNGRDENGVRTVIPTSKVDDHRAGLVTADRRCVDIENVLRRYELTASRRASKTGISLTAPQAIYDRAGGGEYGHWLLQETLEVITQVWPIPDMPRHNGHLLTGVAYVIHALVAEHMQKHGGNIADYGRAKVVRGLRRKGWSPERMQDEARQEARRSSKGYNTLDVWGAVIRDQVDKRLQLPRRWK